ncbi:MAG TPA: type VI secretion system tip protein TssI/VgrG [Polyangiaceae bacterium]|jgi:type VI secretion system secreted protein VgrG
MKPLYELEGAFLPGPTRVFRFDCVEAMSTPYVYRVDFVLETAAALALDLDGATGEDASLVVHDRDGNQVAVVHGIVAAFEHVEERGVAGWILRAHLAPRLSRLAFGEHSRVFVAKALPDILTETLTDGGLEATDFDLRLTGSYAPLPHVCQYRESRLAFVTRWLERVGAYYFFEQGQDREKLVVTDDPSSQTAALQGPVPFAARGVGGDVSADQAIRSLRPRTVAVPAHVRVTDYNFSNPSLAVVGEADVVAGPGGVVSLFDVNVDLPGDAKVHAATVASRHLSMQTTYRIVGRVVGLSAGFTFSVEDHPRAALNQAYLVTGLRQEAWDFVGDQERPADRPPQGHRTEIDAVAAGQRWFPPAVTPWPRIAGSVRAKIDGPQDSDYAQLDENGCYLVRLMFDESGLPDGGASELVRMIQPHAGNPEGMHFPLRKGTEVQIAFLKGDPDQPIIAGAVPNSLTPSSVTKANASQNVLQTGGQTRLEIEDKQGSEYVDLSCPPKSTFLHLGAHAGLGTHNFAFSTEGDYSMHTGTNRDITVGAKQNESVTGNVTETYHSKQTTTVSGSLTETIDGGATQTIHAGATQSIDGGMTQTVSGGETRTVTGGQTETLSGGRTQTINGSSTESITGSLTQTITGGATTTTPAKHAVIATGGFELSTPATITLIANGGFKLFAPGGQTRLDSDWTMLGGESFSHADNQLTLVGVRIDLRAFYGNVGAFQMNSFILKSSTGAKQSATVGVLVSGKGVVATSHLLSKHTGTQLWGG